MNIHEADELTKTSIVEMVYDMIREKAKSGKRTLQLFFANDEYREDDVRLVEKDLEENEFDVSVKNKDSGIQLCVRWFYWPNNKSPLQQYIEEKIRQENEATLYN